MSDDVTDFRNACYKLCHVTVVHTSYYRFESHKYFAQRNTLSIYKNKITWMDPCVRPFVILPIIGLLAPPFFVLFFFAFVSTFFCQISYDSYYVHISCTWRKICVPMGWVLVSIWVYVSKCILYFSTMSYNDLEIATFQTDSFTIVLNIISVFLYLAQLANI